MDMDERLVREAVEAAAAVDRGVVEKWERREVSPRCTGVWLHLQPHHCGGEAMMKP